MAKPPAFPKRMGACADLLYDLRQQRLAMQRDTDELQARENALMQHIIDNLPKGDTGAAGERYRVQVKPKSKPVVKDWDAFWAFVFKKRASALLQRRITETAVQELLDDPKLRGGVPGVEEFRYPSISLTKV